MNTSTTTVIQDTTITITDTTVGKEDTLRPVGEERTFNPAKEKAHGRHMLLWVDVETTSVDPVDGDLLELGLILTDMHGDQVASFHTLINPGHLNTNTNPQHAINLHSKNGLLTAICSQDTPDYREAAHALADWVDAHVADLERTHPAGTNVDFDLAWIRAKLGPVLAWVSHRKLDLTSLRLTAIALGHNPYKRAHATDHRTSTCLDRDISEYRTVIDAIRILRDDQEDQE